MLLTEQRRALECAVEAALEAGGLMRHHLRTFKKINEATRHDIKLELDVRCQQVIERKLRSRFPEIAVLGEEGDIGNEHGSVRWVVDPIDGTVNFAHGIPHACVSIALQLSSPEPGGQARKSKIKRRAANPFSILHPPSSSSSSFQTIAGVVYDPFLDELWTALRGQRARLNGKVIHVSRRKLLSDAIVTIGFAKSAVNLEKTLPCFEELARRALKIRIMGSAALALTYVATGRFDAYLERSVRLWDVAAGGLIVECAGGDFWHVPSEEESGAYRMIATNGILRKQLPPLG